MMDAPAQAAKSAYLLIDQERVDPWTVIVDLGAKGTSLSPAELHLGVALLLFELQQSQVDVERKDVLNFVKDDLKNHPLKALEAYLTIARFVVNPPSRQKPAGWFTRVFGSLPSRTPPAPAWKWVAIAETSLSEDQDVLVIRGLCLELSRCPLAPD